MCIEVCVRPAAEQWVMVIGGVIRAFVALKECWGGEISLDAGKKLLIHAGELRADQFVTGIDPCADVFDTIFMHGDLDARFVFVLS